MAGQPNGLLRKLGGQADPIYVGLYRAALSVAIALIGWFATTTWTEVREDLRALRNTLHAIDTRLSVEERRSIEFERRIDLIERRNMTGRSPAGPIPIMPGAPGDRL